MFSLENDDVSVIREVAQKSKSRICGFILYTRADAHITKVIKDEDYWDALDAASGENWPIFAVKPLNKTCCIYANYRSRLCEEDNKVKEPSENSKYLNFFRIDSTDSLPCFVAFYIKDNDEVEQLTCKIKGRTKVDTYNSLREIVDEIAKAERLILPQYKRTENVFREAASNLHAYCFRRSIAGVFMGLKYVKPLNKLLGGMI